MRIIIFGVGAVGGVVAATLALSSRDVVGIARGKRFEALRDTGLTLRSHAGTEHVRIPVVDTPAGITPRADDMILLATKTQDTIAALDALRQAGFDDQPVFCMQNGVANEAMALRFFPNVHSVAVMLPAEYMAVDEAIAFGRPNVGVFDIGRFPGGSDAADAAMAAALTDARIPTFVVEEAMQNKYGKLLVNLGNIVEAALGREVRAAAIRDALMSEAIGVYETAGIRWTDMGEGDPRRGTLLSIEPIPGLERVGGSTSQSLARGAGSIETDYMNGEIALIARLAGSDAPLNARAASLAARLARSKQPSGCMNVDDLKSALGL